MRVGLIGCGGMGTTHSLSLRALSEQYDIQVTAIADPRKEFLDRAVEQWPNAEKYSYGKDLIENAEVEIIYICVPSYLHAALAIMAMEKGCHVFVEKPVCLSKEDCEKLLKAEKKTGVTVMVGQVVRYFKEYVFLKNVYDRKTYGRLKSIMMHRLSGDVKWGYEDWFHDIKKSGSVVLDLHIHDTDFLRYMMGEPESCSVHSTAFDGGMPNQIVTAFQYSDAFAVVEGTWDISSKMPFEAYYRASFEEATVVFSSLHEPHVVVYHKDGTASIPEIVSEFDVEDGTAGINISNLGPYYTEDKYYIECLINKVPIEIAPLSEGVKSVELALNELALALSR